MAGSAFVFVTVERTMIRRVEREPYLLLSAANHNFLVGGGGCGGVVKKLRFRLDSVYVVNDAVVMPTLVQSCRIEPDHAALLSRQAKRRHLEVSTLSSLYLKEKALEEEYPGIGFRDAVGGREAYVLGHRVAVWEVGDVYRETGSIAKTAEFFRWPAALVRCALAYAKQFTAEVRQQRESEVGA